MTDELGFEPKFRDGMTVELVRSNASDADVLFAARVSTLGEQTLAQAEAGDAVSTDETSKRDRGLVNYLMRDRHGCYDANTQVLTARGWVAWPEVVESDVFITRNLKTDQIEYQKAQRIVSDDYDGELYHFKNKHLDLLVTPNHNMVVSHRLNAQGFYSPLYLRRADETAKRAYRIPKTGGVWVGEEAKMTISESFFKLFGFFIGDGTQAASGSSPTFNIRKEREIDFLEATVNEIQGAAITLMKSGARVVSGLSANALTLLKDCYDPETREKRIPPQFLSHKPSDLAALLEGLMASDGYSVEHRKRYFTTSSILRDQILELALKLGIAADFTTSTNTEGKYAGERSKPVHIISFFSGRNSNPRLAWTKADREREITVERYVGKIYCATVENGTLFVRRNGKTAWCGNSPFEHNSMTFYVQAPIFVFREFMRHRIASYNEESGRYRELNPVFYVPNRERNLRQVGKPGAYDFLPGTDEQSELVEKLAKEQSIAAYSAYQQMLDAGVAREVARIVLPLNLYSSMYVTMNARALMNFLSLRTKHPEATTPSFPQREIEMCAEQMEAEWAKLMPLTHAAFTSKGRVAP